MVVISTIFVSMAATEGFGPIQSEILFREPWNQRNLSGSWDHKLDYSRSLSWLKGLKVTFWGKGAPTQRFVGPVPVVFLLLLFLFFGGVDDFSGQQKVWLLVLANPLDRI